VSEEGWKAFLHAEGVDDWVVLHGGATVVYPVGSLRDAAALAGAIAEVPGLEGSGAVLTIAADHLSVRLTRDLWRIGTEHVEFARAVSTVARSRGVVADRSAVQEVQLAISAKHDDIDTAFWRAVLGYDPLAEDNAVDPLGHGSTVWMQELDATKALRHAMHVDVSVAREHVEARLAAALAAGGRIVDDSAAPEAWILADRAGNKVCIAAWPDGAMRPGRSDSVEGDGRELWAEIHPLYEAGRYAEAAERGLEVVRAHPHPRVFYNVACCESLAGRTADAVEHLRQAIDLWEPCRAMAKQESDFDPIRDDPAFHALIGG
jgi:4a-hydroxytetrahydrobiopterin dehydratase